MIIQPKVRGFICTTAHPTGCYNNVKNDCEYATANLKTTIPKRVLVIGSSTGYGLACRTAAAFGGDANTVGVFLEREATEKRTATAGYYNDSAFAKLAKYNDTNHISINADAYSAQTKQQVIAAIKEAMPQGKVDLIVYSLASPKRTSDDGSVYSSVIKPVCASYKNKTVNFHTGEITDIEIPPATKDEIADTIAVMGGEDWQLWLTALKQAGVLADGLVTVAFSYIGPDITHQIYKDGTIGLAKQDLENKARTISADLAPLNGRAIVCVNKALVTQSSSAIPVVPLYISMLYKIMKANGTHEGAIAQAVRMLQRIYSSDTITLDTEGRIRLDDLEMKPAVQAEVLDIWSKINTENIYELSDLAGYQREFYSLFGFGVDGVDYTKPVEL